MTLGRVVNLLIRGYRDISYIRKELITGLIRGKLDYGKI